MHGAPELRLSTVVADSPDPKRLAEWWANLLGGNVRETAPGDFYVVDVPGQPVRLAFQYIEHPTPGKNRLHLDLDTAPSLTREQLGKQLVAIGATHVGDYEERGIYWSVFTDPDGNQFCAGDPEHE